MNAVVCPFKPVVQRERALTVTEEKPHEHDFLAQINLGGGLWVQDCSCGHRQLARKGAYGEVEEVFSDGTVDGGSSVENCVFLKDAAGHFVHRWQPAVEVEATH